jgi:transcriptional regulator NrdR family protein
VKCPKCNCKTKVVDTEKGDSITGRFLGMPKMKELVEEWGESSVFRNRKCTGCGSKFLTIEFSQV